MHKTGEYYPKEGSVMDQMHKKLEQCRNADLMTCDPGGLVDLCGVRIDTSRPVQERMTDFARQVSNPYLFRVDGLIINAVFPSDAVRRLEDALLHC